MQDGDRKRDEVGGVVAWRTDERPVGRAVYRFATDCELTA